MHPETAMCRVKPGSSCERPAKVAGTPVIRRFRHLFRSIATVSRCLSKSMNQSTADWPFCDKLAAPRYNRSTAASILGTRNVPAPGRRLTRIVSAKLAFLSLHTLVYFISMGTNCLEPIPYHLA